ncbi:MAG: DUF4760 domain-containing protein [Hyphomonadaceae bacterium]|nr:DUF4760 domain-containing protein [Hyphomonadaceae bacterium]
MHDCLFELNSTSVTAWATVGLLIATLVLAVVAGYQIHTLRAENRRERTLSVCMKYDSDSVIVESTRSLRRARNSGDIRAKTSKFRSEIVSLLNYLDLIAIGIRRGLFSEEIARDHMESIVIGEFDFYVASGLAAKVETHDPLSRINLADYDTLKWLRDRWSKPASREPYLNRVVVWLKSFPRGD